MGGSYFEDHTTRNGKVHTLYLCWLMVSMGMDRNKNLLYPHEMNYENLQIKVWQIIQCISNRRPKLGLFCIFYTWKDRIWNFQENCRIHFIKLCYGTVQLALKLHVCVLVEPVITWKKNTRWMILRKHSYRSAFHHCRQQRISQSKLGNPSVRNVKAPNKRWRRECGVFLPTLQKLIVPNTVVYDIHRPS